ncbi:MAG: tetratricopeptide repeat protein [FCB group bacterium]|nr:tetratricopeptide repeat protein [FCB group bacterium]
MSLTDRNNLTRYCLPAISLLIAVIVISGCATKQDVMRVDEKVTQVRNDQRLFKVQIDKIDSLFISGTESNNRLRVDVRSSLEDVIALLDQLKNQMDDLQQIVYRIEQQPGQSGTVIQQPLAAQPTDTAEAATDTTASVTSAVDCRRLWDNAFKDMRRGQYDLALSGFSDYLKYCPKDNLSDNCQYWIAVTYQEMKQYESAITEFQKLLDSYPDSEKRSLAYFKIGRSYEELGNKTKALEYFLVLKDQFPETVEYEQAKDKIELWQKETEN